MKTIGLTGSIGSGKTTVSKIIESLGYPVFNSDSVAKQQLDKSEIILKLIEKFGNNILTEHGEIDKKNLANIVFDNPTNLNFLNSLIHPFVFEEFDKWKNKQESSLIFMESAIIFEQNFEKLFDKIICVWAPEKVCIERCKLRNNMDEKAIKLRISKQISPKIKCAKSDIVIINDNFTAILPQIIHILNELKTI